MFDHIRKVVRHFDDPEPVNVTVNVIEPKSDHWHCRKCSKPWGSSIRASLCCLPPDLPDLR
jgi:hypothetical protein